MGSGNIDYLPLVQPGFVNGTVMNNSNGIAGAVVTTYNLTVTKEPEYYSNISVVVGSISGTTVA